MIFCILFKSHDHVVVPREQAAYDGEDEYGEGRDDRATSAVSLA